MLRVYVLFEEKRKETKNEDYCMNLSYKFMGSLIIILIGYNIFLKKRRRQDSRILFGQIKINFCSNNFHFIS